MMHRRNSHQFVTKRSFHACTRCRRQKIKCSGLEPCMNCTQRRLTCTFDERDQKIMITQGYLTELQQKVARLESYQAAASTRERRIELDENTAVSGPECGNAEISQYEHNLQDSGTGPETSPTTPRLGAAKEDPSPELTNPLIATPSRYMAASDGMSYFLGTSSNWSFTRRVLALTHEHVYKVPISTDALLFDGCAYDLEWDGSQANQILDSRAIPSIDYAIFLINGVKYHCCQLFHLFEETEIMTSLHRFYSELGHGREAGGLWYIHMLLVLALGKSLIQRKTQGKKPAGVELFVKALQLLPNVIALTREPIVSTEILCCVAWYLQALDYRHAAHSYIVQAKSIAMNFGMHTDMPIAELGDQVVQRCRKIWWTVYVSDRQMTSLMGLPQSIRDEGVHCQLPIYSGSTQRTAAVSMQIKFARIAAEISMTIYGTDGRLDKEFVRSTKVVLEKISRVADELQSTFPLPADERYSGISRLTAHMHLLYYQCIVLATRPLLLVCLMKKLESPLQAIRLVTLPQVRKPLLMCVESSDKILNILESLWAQDSLETFLPLDLDSVYVSTVVLLIAYAVDPQLSENRPSWLTKSYTVLDEMISSGNLVAGFRKSEIQKLDEIFRDFTAKQFQTPLSRSESHQAVDAPFANTWVGQPLPPSEETERINDYNTASDSDELGHGRIMQLGDLTAEHIMNVANSMEMSDSDWMTLAMSFEQSS